MIKTQAYARAGLLGNPSDGYNGRTISIIVKNFGAWVLLFETPELRIEPQVQDKDVFRNIHDLAESVAMTGYYGGERLIKAAIKKFHSYAIAQGLRLHNKNFTVRYHSSIPRQVGLAGSSAIITAAFRALIRFYDIEISEPVLPSLVLSAERDELGINAGLQDRVIQTYEGCVYMDFDKSFCNAHGHGKYERLDTALLPNLYIAYKTDLCKVSGKVLNDMAVRYAAGDEETVEIISRIARLPLTGREALEAGDLKTLNVLINENFDCRRRIMNISESNLEMVRIARECGASAKFTGSGGAIIGVYDSDEVLARLIVELKKVSVRVLKPYIN